MWQTIGQERTIQLLKNSLEHGKLAHAYLLVGPPHVGKMRLAIDLAKALNCVGSDPPCNLCLACQRIENGKHSDIIIIDKYTGRDSKDKKKATEISIDTIRDFMQRNANLPPYEGRYKIFIIDNAELMSSAAANCLLKILEEPPEHVIIILLTPAENQLLPTIISRCQRLELRPMPILKIESTLAATAKLDTDKSRLLARLSAGCLGWALSAMQDESYLQNRQSLLSEFISMIDSSWSSRLSYIQKIPSDRAAAEAMIKLWMQWYRDMLLVKYNREEAIINLDHIAELKFWASTLTIAEIKEFIDSLNRALNNLAYNVNLHLLFEVIMLDMPKKKEGTEPALSSVNWNQS